MLTACEAVFVMASFIIVSCVHCSVAGVFFRVNEILTKICVVNQGSFIHGLFRKL